MIFTEIVKDELISKRNNAYQELYDLFFSIIRELKNLERTEENKDSVAFCESDPKFLDFVARECTAFENLPETAIFLGPLFIPSELFEEESIDARRSLIDKVAEGDRNLAALIAAMFLINLRLKKQVAELSASCLHRDTVNDALQQLGVDDFRAVAGVVEEYQSQILHLKRSRKEIHTSLVEVHKSLKKREETESALKQTSSMLNPVYQAIESENLEALVDQILDKKMLNHKLELLNNQYPSELQKTLPTPAMVAAYLGKVSALQTILSSGPDLTIKDDYNRGIVHYAAMNGSEEIMSEIEALGLNLNEFDNFGRSPLHYAALGGGDYALRALWIAGGDINLQDNNENTPLMFAVRSGNFSNIELLVQNGCEIYDKIIVDAGLGGSVEAIKLFAGMGKPVNINSGSRTALLNATIKGHSAAAIELIKLGANVNDALPKSNKTPLIFAAGNGTPELVQALIDAGADISHSDSYGNTPLSTALNNNRNDVIKILLNNGAKTAKNAEPPAHTAARLDNMELLLHAEEYGIDLNAVDCNGLSAAHWLVDRGAAARIRELKDLLPMDTPDNRGMTPLHIAAFTGSIDCVLALIDAGANIDRVDKQGNTPIHISIKKEYDNITKALIDKGANINIQNNDRMTPLMIAVVGKSYDAVEMLVDAGASFEPKDSFGRDVRYYARMTQVPYLIQIVNA